MINFIDEKNKFIFTKNILSFSTHSNFFLYKHVYAFTDDFKSQTVHRSENNNIYDINVPLAHISAIPRTWSSVVTLLLMLQYNVYFHFYRYSVVGWRAEGPSGGGVVGDGCSWWSVEGGDAEGMLMAARKTVPTVALC